MARYITSVNVRDPCSTLVSFLHAGSFLRAGMLVTNYINPVKAEKYVIVTENSGQSSMRIRFGFGAAGEEVQKLLGTGAEKIRVKIDGLPSETIFPSGRTYKLVDIKHQIKGLSFPD
jgi:hypothetical protein